MGEVIRRVRALRAATRRWTAGQADAAIALAVGGVLAVQRLAAGVVPAAQAVPAILAILAIAGGLALRRRAPLTGYLVGSTGCCASAEGS